MRIRLENNTEEDLILPITLENNYKIVNNVDKFVNDTIDNEIINEPTNIDEVIFVSDRLYNIFIQINNTFDIREILYPDDISKFNSFNDVKLINSLYIFDYFDNNDTNNQNKIYTSYYHFNGNIISTNITTENVSVLIPENELENIDFLYLRIRFFNASTGKIITLVRQNDTGDEEEDLYIRVSLNIEDLTYEYVDYNVNVNLKNKVSQVYDDELDNITNDNPILEDSEVLDNNIIPIPLLDLYSYTNSDCITNNLNITPFDDEVSTSSDDLQDISGELPSTIVFDLYLVTGDTFNSTINRIVNPEFILVENQSIKIPDQKGYFNFALRYNSNDTELTPNATINNFSGNFKISVTTESFKDPGNTVTEQGLGNISNKPITNPFTGDKIVYELNGDILITSISDDPDNEDNTYNFSLSLSEPSNMLNHPQYVTEANDSVNLLLNNSFIQIIIDKDTNNTIV